MANHHVLSFSTSLAAAAPGVAQEARDIDRIDRVDGIVGNSPSLRGVLEIQPPVDVNERD